MNSMFLVWFLCVFVLKVVAVTGPEVALYLQNSLSKASAIFLPSDSNYTTQRWNLFMAPAYIVSVKPATDVDVQTIVG